MLKGLLQFVCLLGFFNNIHVIFKMLQINNSFIVIFCAYFVNQSIANNVAFREVLS
jgi:hypothetical protein